MKAKPSEVCAANVMRSIAIVPKGAPKYHCQQDTQGGEGELCAGEEVTLAEVSGVTALVRIKPGQTKMTYEIILEQNSEWGSPCMLSIDYVSEYGVEQKSCSGEFCKPFSEAAIRLANTYGSNTDYERSFDAASFSSENQTIWAKMLRTAELQELEWKDAPISSLEGTPNSYYRFKKRLFLPILIDNHLFLANLGTAGFGAGVSYWGPLLCRL